MGGCGFHRGGARRWPGPPEQQTHQKCGATDPQPAARDQGAQRFAGPRWRRSTPGPTAPHSERGPARGPRRRSLFGKESGEQVGAAHGHRHTLRAERRHAAAGVADERDTTHPPPRASQSASVQPAMPAPQIRMRSGTVALSAAAGRSARPARCVPALRVSCRESGRTRPTPGGVPWHRPSAPRQPHRGRGCAPARGAAGVRRR